MKGQFLPSEEYYALAEEEKNNGCISPKDDTLKSFLEGRPAAAAFFNIIYSYMNNKTMEEARCTIDSYARTEGTTWRVMRAACGLSPAEPPRKRDNVGEIPRQECEYIRLVELSDALAIAAIEQNCEVVTNASSLGFLWKKISYPRPVSAPQGEKKASEFPNKMLEKGLWIKHGVTVKGPPCYCPVITCEGSMEDIYMRSQRRGIGVL